MSGKLIINLLKWIQIKLIKINHWSIGKKYKRLYSLFLIQYPKAKKLKIC
jgi:hypothetical protein